MAPNAKVILTVRDSPEVWIKSGWFSNHLSTILVQDVKPTRTLWVLIWKSFLVRDTIFVEKFGNVPLVGRFPFSLLIRLMPAFLIPGRRMNQEIYASRIWLGKEQKWNDQEVAKMYNRWIEHVTDTIPKGRGAFFLTINWCNFSDKLLIYNVKEGWAPLCEFLEVPIPKEPMPRSNDKGQFVKRINDRNRSHLTRCVLWYGGLIIGSIYLWKNGRLIVRSVNTVIYA